MEKSKMRSNKIIILAILFAPVFLLAGCSSSQQPADLAVEDVPVERPQDDSIAKRFQEPDPEGPTVVESAMKLSGEYARLTQEAAELRRQNEDFIAKNRQLNDQAVSVDAQLKQTQKELAEANSLLIEMRVELNNWKTDILGFRNEMRDAETAQLETLLRILKVLGGQVASESAKAEKMGTVGSAIASLNKPDRPQ
jgi:DNA repair exonuclease SbcCD ATPase subunit